MQYLTAYLSKWHLSTPNLLTTTATSHVYTVQHENKTVVLKLLTPLGIEDETGGAAALQHFHGQGAVRLIRHDAGAHLLEYADGNDLIPMVRRGEDTEATTIIAAVLRELHTTQITTPSPELKPLRRWFRSLFEQAQAEHGETIFVRAARTADKLLTQPQDERVLHGDIHHENVRYATGRGWLAIDPKGLYGERTYDVANALCNPVSMPALVQDETRLLHHAGIFADQLALERSRILQFVFAYACLSASWSLNVGEDASHALEMAYIAEKLTG